MYVRVRVCVVYMLCVCVGVYPSHKASVFVGVQLQQWSPGGNVGVQQLRREGREGWRGGRESVVGGVFT